MRLTPRFTMLVALVLSLLGAELATTVLDTLQWGLLAVVSVVGLVGIRVTDALERGRE